MTITSLSFILLIFATLIVYYLVPKKYQWAILLIASAAFYLLSSWKGALFVLITASTVYGASIAMQSISDKQKLFLKENKDSLSKEEKTALKEKNKKRRKALLIGTLVLNFGIMCVCKYAHFAVDTANSFLSVLGRTAIDNSFSLIVPLGLSFYTFQSVGYLVNIYWGNYKAEKNYLKVLLFVSFFPQMTQGPISEYEQLSAELFSEHSFSYKNYSWGFQRLLWGFMKKMLIADVLSPYVADVFANYRSYAGITVLIGAFMYSVQIYADFSGYMDIMCGYCEMLGIKLTENFERPYFSKSIAEYWRRWHISLGAWFKQYIYYPIGVSKWNRNLGKKLTEKFGKTIGKNLPATIALVAVWLTTGLWHGASWAYVAWGGVNGLFIIFSMWMEPVYAKIKTALKINEGKWLWKAFQTLRTFVLVTFIKVLPEVGTLSEGFGLWKQIFIGGLPLNVSELLPFIDFSTSFAILQTMVLCFFSVLLFVISLYERKKDFRSLFNHLCFPIRCILLLGMWFCIFIFGVALTTEGGFMYAQF